jgi:hypothetical protein
MSNEIDAVNAPTPTEATPAPTDSTESTEPTPTEATVPVDSTPVETPEVPVETPEPEEDLTPMAPNDPNRIPLAHRKLVNDIISVLQANDIDVFESQQIVSAAAMVARVSDLAKAQVVMNSIIEAVKETPDAQRDIQAIIQIINLKMNEALNKQKLTDIQFEDFTV